MTGQEGVLHAECTGAGLKLLLQELRCAWWIQPCLHTSMASACLLFSSGERGEAESPTVSCCSQALLSLGASASSHKMALQRCFILWISFLYNLNALMGA